jgi:hypothetical protein
VGDLSSQRIWIEADFFEDRGEFGEVIWPARADHRGLPPHSVGP